MPTEKRKSARRAMKYAAWAVLDDGKHHDCTVADVSAAGARLSCAAADEIPADFVLLLSRRGAPKRYCHVIWRKPAELGVEFESAEAVRMMQSAKHPGTGTAPEDRREELGAEPA